MWTRLEGAFFADAVYLPKHEAECGETTFYDVGYGLRWIADVMSVSPAMISLDMGVPISKCQASQARSLTVYLSFLQSFSVF